MRHVTTLAALLAATTLATPAFSATLTNDLATWQALAGTWTNDQEYGDEFSSVSSVTLDDGTTMSLSTPLEIRTVGTSWGSWCCGYAGDVLFTGGGSSVSVDLSPSVDDFGFYVEPNNFGLFNVTLTLDDGSTISTDVEGSAGATFFGWNGAGIDSFTITAADEAAGFAFGDIYVSSDATPVVPEPASWAMMLAGFGAVGYAMRRRERRFVQAA